MSVVSVDSGCVRDSGSDVFCCEFESATTTSDLATTCSATGTDDDDEVRIPQLSGSLLPNPQIAQQKCSKSRRTARRRREKKRHGNRNLQSSSSTASPEPMTIDDVVLKVYICFQQLLHSFTQQQTACLRAHTPQFADFDGRWGAHCPNSAREHFNGCFVMPSTSNDSNPLGYWAVPHPSIYLGVFITYIQTYLIFLQKLYPTLLGKEVMSKRGVHLTNVSRDVKLSVNALLDVLKQTSALPNPDFDDFIRTSDFRSYKRGSFVGNIPIVPTYAMQNVAISEQYKHSMSNSQQQLNISGTSDACGSDDGRRSMNEIASLNVDHPGSGSAGGSNSSSTSRKPPPPAPLVSAFDENGDFFVSKMDVLSEEIWNFHNSVTQTDTTLNRKLFLRDMLYYAISPIFPSLCMTFMFIVVCGLYVVGSSLNGFGNNSSDMDLCLMITNKDLDQKSDAVCVLNLVVLALEKVEWIREQHVPILRIRFREPFGDITVDLNANNSVAIRNTHLVRPLVTIVKEWAKRMGMNDANKSSFTSYSLVLMVIHYLQCGLEIPILPALQQALPKIFNTKQDVRSLNVSHCLPSIPNWKQNSESNLGELLIGFLEYYSKHFRYENDAISVRLGKKIERAVVAKYPRNTAMLSTHWMAQWRCVCIEEPFTFSNTAHSIHEEMVFEKIKAAFRCAHDELSSTHDLNTWLENCKPIAAQSVNSGAMVSFEKTSDCCKVRTSTSLRSITSVTSTVQRTREDHSSTSTASSENEAETVKESAIAHLFSTGVIAAITPQTPTSPVHGRVHQQSQNAQLSNQRSRGQNGRNSRGKYFQARVQ